MRIPALTCRDPHVDPITVARLESGTDLHCSWCIAYESSDVKPARFTVNGQTACARCAGGLVFDYLIWPI
jgi:hypothetical protein